RNNSGKGDGNSGRCSGGRNGANSGSKSGRKSGGNCGPKLDRVLPTFSTGSGDPHPECSAELSRDQREWDPKVSGGTASIRRSAAPARSGATSPARPAR